ncbi:WG repeat-containing protein [Mucilaginibacter polytrichastri]|uniref:WG repeat-containing protein n=1 Tax=Mucilaginibacter polytrichastri TaxID=1302689 RepID=A0A1Q6A0E7_9SPHI|nr:WG repeat-containing protein [Mucilaginibacter polytrichastri]OKS87452.1 hypothetical protein RG47T_2913 [Mucilaginibacter polytrichastri]SFS90811.1 WG containing repeat-containing protein [Mucilaginibacter polytrichastri]
MRNTKRYLLLLLFCISISSLHAQIANNWFSYYNAQKESIGYKDANGKIKIPAHFNGLTHTSTFRNIIAVDDADTHTSYYLLKNGQNVAKDSLYVWDFTYDCEQEGTIRFRDPVTDRVGFLDKNGKVNIRAVYNDARPFYNGLALVIHDGKRICADGTPYKAEFCEHWSWDGITALINKKGEIVADSINIMNTANLNWYSGKVADGPADTTLYTSFKAKNNKYYTFINYQKEFENWFYQHFLSGLQSNSLPSYCFDELTVEGLWKQTLRKHYSKDIFIKKYSALLLLKLAAVKKRQLETSIVSEELNTLIYNSRLFKTYHTDCGAPNTAKFPSFDVITSHYTNSHQLNYQEHYSFLRTTDGYKLIAVALKSIK